MIFLFFFLFLHTSYEAMPDLIYMLHNLTDENGEIMIPGIMDDVAPLAKDETKIYDGIEFDVSAYHAEINATELRHKGDKVKNV